MNRTIAKTTLLVAMLTALTACSGTPTRESTGEYLDDSVITTKVKAAFVEDKAVNALDIKVVTFKGAVQLSGFANNPQEIDRAVQLARGVKGVTAVKNDIRLK